MKLIVIFFIQNKTTEENERRLSSEMQKIREEMGECKGTRHETNYFKVNATQK